MTSKAGEVEQLAQRYGGRVYAFCRRLALSQVDADDLYQQTYLRVLDMPQSVDLEKNPSGFLMAVATRIWRDEVRKFARRHRIAPTQQGVEDGMDTIADKSYSIEEQVNLNEMKMMINITVEQLPDTLRVPILLYYMGDLSIGEISKALDVPQGTVKSRLYHARQKLKEELEGRGYEAES